MTEIENFIKNLESYGIGVALSRMADAQKRVIAGVRETGKPGTVTLKLTYKAKGADVVIVGAEVNKKVPQDTIRPVEMFVDGKLDLYEENPEQMSFDNVHDLKKQKIVG